MATLLQVTRFLNKELNIKKIKDSSKNGMQVRGRKEVKKIGFAVDACIEVFEKAKRQSCDLVVVHHGLLWKGLKDYEKLTLKRIRFMKKNRMSLYAAHLPLDLHCENGNNILIAKLLGLKKIKIFGKYHKIPLGYEGEFEKKINLPDIEKKINNTFQTKCKILGFGKKSIKNIGILSGGGSSALPEAIEKKLDCFLTGEESHHSYHFAKENKINMIFAGHYATETLGVRALMPVLEQKFGVKTVFIDAPTGL